LLVANHLNNSSARGNFLVRLLLTPPVQSCCSY